MCLIGQVYLFKKAVCTAFAQVLRGKVQCMEVAIGGNPGVCICMYMYVCIVEPNEDDNNPWLLSGDYKVIVGGVGGAVKVLDGRTLTLLQSFSLLDAVAVPKGGESLLVTLFSRIVS